MRNIDYWKEHFKKLQATRENASLFEIREPGYNLNKIKKWNDAIIIDTSMHLFDLLFNERCACGNSIMILPDRRYIFIRSDAHSEIFQMKKQEIEKRLGK